MSSNTEPLLPDGSGAEGFITTSAAPGGAESTAGGAPTPATRGGGTSAELRLGQGGKILTRLVTRDDGYCSSDSTPKGTGQ